MGVKCTWDSLRLAAHWKCIGETTNEESKCTSNSMHSHHTGCALAMSSAINVPCNKILMSGLALKCTSNSLRRAAHWIARCDHNCPELESCKFWILKARCFLNNKADVAQSIPFAVQISLHNADARRCRSHFTMRMRGAADLTSQCGCEALSISLRNADDVVVCLVFVSHRCVTLPCV